MRDRGHHQRGGEVLEMNLLMHVQLSTAPISATKGPRPEHHQEPLTEEACERLTNEPASWVENSHGFHTCAGPLCSLPENGSSSLDPDVTVQLLSK